MKKFFIVLLSFVMLFSFVSCDNTDVPDLPDYSEREDEERETTNTQDTQPQNSNQRIDLDINNYKTYLTYQSAAGRDYAGRMYDDFTHTFKGALNYAYYGNVVCTFEIRYVASIDNQNKIYEGEYSVALNAAGEGEFRANDLALLERINASSALNQHFYLVDTLKITLKSVSGEIIIPFEIN